MFKRGMIAMIIKIPRSESYSHGMTDSFTPIEYEHYPSLLVFFFVYYLNLVLGVYLFTFSQINLVIYVVVLQFIGIDFESAMHST